MSNTSKLTVSFGGNMYPMSPYNLTIKTIGIASTNDLMKSFIEYVSNKDNLKDRPGALLDFSKYQVQNIYIFRTRQSIENLSSACSIQCELKADNAHKTF